jgi:hypothetical protein
VEKWDNFAFRQSPASHLPQQVPQLGDVDRDARNLANPLFAFEVACGIVDRRGKSLLFSAAVKQRRIAISLAVVGAKGLRSSSVPPTGSAEVAWADRRDFHY